LNFPFGFLRIENQCIGLGWIACSMNFVFDSMKMNHDIHLGDL
jgi:hypothetical protein